jgi:hypothetical protein
MMTACVATVLFAQPARSDVHLHRLDAPIQAAGTICFKFHLDRAYRNGAGVEPATVTFLEIPGLAEASLVENPSQVGLSWRWIGVRGAPRTQMLIPELPGPETYLMQVTWDANRGLQNAYVDGVPLQEAGVSFDPWEFPRTAQEAKTLDGPVTVSDLKFHAGFVSAEAARQAVPGGLPGRSARVFGPGEQGLPAEIEARRGPLLLDAALAAAGDVDGWVLEGPGKITFADGWMEMRSTRPDASGGENGHIVFWCPRDFPERFLAEWEVQLVGDFGLCIVFFAAKGAGGEDIFDPSLPARDGTFAHYIRGAVNSYHISYYASTPGTPGRISSNLRKNNKFYLMASGPVAIPAGSGAVHRMRLVKDGGHIQLQADGRVSIDFTDTGGPRYGPVYGGGKIGLRQMQWTVGRYRNLRVWKLLAE